MLQYPRDHFWHEKLQIYNVIFHQGNGLAACPLKIRQVGHSYSLVVRGRPLTMLSQNRKFLTLSPTPLFAIFIISRVYLVNRLWGYPLPYRDNIVYGRPMAPNFTVQWSFTITYFISVFKKNPSCI